MHMENATINTAGNCHKHTQSFLSLTRPLTWQVTITNTHAQTDTHTDTDSFLS